MASVPPRMTPPYEGPSAPIRKVSALTIVLIVIGGLAALCCIGGVVMVIGLRPVFLQAREAARSGICKANLSQLATGIAMYADDFDGTLPRSDAWMDGISPYVRQHRMFQCPTVRIQTRSGYGYAFNKELSGKKKATLDRNSPLVFDSTLMNWNATSGTETLPVPGRHHVQKSRIDNVVRLDGSSKAETK